MERERGHDKPRSSLNALHLVAITESANNPIGVLGSAESEERDPVLLQIRGAS